MLTKHFIQFSVTRSGIESAEKELGTSISTDFHLKAYILGGQTGRGKEWQC
jgi:hypothetical protein